MHHISAKEIGFQLQAEGSTAGVTPQSTRVRAKAALQPGLTFSINSPSRSHKRTLAKQKKCKQIKKKDAVNYRKTKIRLTFSTRILVMDGEKHNIFVVPVIHTVTGALLKQHDF